MHYAWPAACSCSSPAGCSASAANFQFKQRFWQKGAAAAAVVCCMLSCCCCHWGLRGAAEAWAWWLHSARAHGGGRRPTPSTTAETEVATRISQSSHGAAGGPAPLPGLPHGTRPARHLVSASLLRIPSREARSGSGGVEVEAVEKHEKRQPLSNEVVH
jgi:hypothetical protein